MPYRMSAQQSQEWRHGDAARVEEAILAELLDRDTIPWDVVVLLDDGSIAFTLDLGEAPARPPREHFDPDNPAHRTIDGWEQAGPHGFFINSVVYCLTRGEARVLLRAGDVLVLRFEQPGPITVEELWP
jgi:hypothetical protein